MATDHDVLIRIQMTLEELLAEAKHTRAARAQWNEDGEQYRVILNDELAATFTVLGDALDFYTEHTCHYCHTHVSAHDGRCCDIQTWTRS